MAGGAACADDARRQRTLGRETRDAGTDYIVLGRRARPSVSARLVRAEVGGQLGLASHAIHTQTLASSSRHMALENRANDPPPASASAGTAAVSS